MSQCPAAVDSGFIATTTRGFVLSLFRDLLYPLFSRQQTVAGCLIEVEVLLGPLCGAACTVTSLAESVGMPRSSVQRAVDRMIGAGTVRLQGGSDDLRERLITLTPAGVVRARAINAAVSEWRAERMRGYFDGGGLAHPLVIESSRPLREFLAEVMPLVDEVAQRHLSGPSVTPGQAASVATSEPLPEPPG